MEWQVNTAYADDGSALMPIPLDGGERVVIDTLKPKGRKWHFLTGMTPDEARKLAAFLIHAADVADFKAT